VFSKHFSASSSPSVPTPAKNTLPYNTIGIGLGLVPKTQYIAR
jgi:hypothetical protein